MVTKQTLIQLIESAKRDVSDAETDIGKLLGELEVQARAEKTTLSQVIDHAFNKLKRARGVLSELEEIVSREVD